MKNPLLFPLFSFILLHFLVAFRLLFFRVRLRFFKEKSPHIVSREDHTSHNFKNMFEMPMLFHVAMLLALVTQVSSPLLVALAWIYVLARACHSVVQCTLNFIPLRFAFFQISMFTLGGIWITLALHLLR